jgi:hypothetical protein
MSRILPRASVLAHAFIASLVLGALGPAGASAQRGSSGTPQRNPSEPQRGSEPARGGSKGTGNARGWIKGFTPATGSEEEDLIGTIKFQPEEKGAKVMTLRVHRRDGFEFKLGDVKLDMDRFPEFIWNGLYCTAGWGLEPTGDSKKKATQKELRSLVLGIVEVRGTLQEISDDFVTLKGCKPLKGDWPDIESAKSGSSSAKPAVKPRDLKVKTFEKISAFLTKDGKAGDPGEYEAGQPVEVWMAFGKGKTLGIMASVRRATAGEQRSEPEPGRPRPLPPPRQGGGRRGGG